MSGVNGFAIFAKAVSLVVNCSINALVLTCKVFSSPFESNMRKAGINEAIS